MRKLVALFAVIFAVLVSVSAFASEKPKAEVKAAKAEVKAAKVEMKEAKHNAKVEMKEAKHDAKVEAKEAKHDAKAAKHAKDKMPK